MTELKYIFLKTKFENQDKKLDMQEFFKLVEHKIGWKEYCSLLDEFTNNTYLTGTEYELLTELGKNRLLEFEKKLIESEKEINTNKKLRDIEIELAESNIKANILNKKNSNFNKWTTISNIIIGLLNVGLLIWQVLKG